MLASRTLRYPFLGISAFACFVCFSVTVAAVEITESESSEPGDSELLPGHSLHGEVFNEGPRQAARLIEGCGPIDFPATTDNELARKFIEQGIGQLHGFWYFEAERSFRHAAMLDPDCAIAYWGMARANTSNSTRAKKFIAQAVERRGNASEMEAMMIDAWAEYHNASGSRKPKSLKLYPRLKTLTDRYPNCLEMRAQQAYAAYKLRSDLKLSYDDVDAQITEVLKREPHHPVHHYRIHLWDYKDAKKALGAAAMCGPSAPAIAHMWHMPGHIYSRLKRYEDAAWQQEASARVDHSHMMRDGVMPDRIHNFAHNNEWLIRNLNNVGRWQDAVDLAKNMTELPRHPKYNTIKKGSASYGRTRLFETLYRYECWSDLIALAHSPHLEPTDDENQQLKRLTYLGIAAARNNDQATCEAVLMDLGSRLGPTDSDANGEDEPPAPETKETKAKIAAAKKKRSGIEKAINRVKGHRELAKGNHKEALALLRKGGEDSVILARVQALSGDYKGAIAAIEKKVKSSAGQVHPLAVQTEIYHLADEQEKTIKSFESLKKISGSVQFGTPVFDRLGDIAESCSIEADWRHSIKPAKDLGKRPDLDSLGPFRWQPSAAPAWTLKDSNDKSISLKDYQGKPTVVIFYLGFGCLHCAEQLHKLAPMKAKFDEAGIEIVAISSDDREGLKRSLNDYEKGMPFPLLSDNKLEVFKQYRVFDDFEDAPLHGLFLVDGEGKIRWSEISYEPFMDLDFFLKESQRLLAQ